MELSDESFGNATYEFFVSTTASVKIVNVDDEVFQLNEFTVDEFFRDFRFFVEWGNGEEDHYISFDLSRDLDGNVTMIRFCSLYVDHLNEYNQPTSLTLYRWNRDTDMYEEIVKPAADQECYSELEQEHL